jgi:hypothetical protein
LLSLDETVNCNVFSSSLAQPTARIFNDPAGLNSCQPSDTQTPALARVSAALLLESPADASVWIFYAMKH